MNHLLKCTPKLKKGDYKKNILDNITLYLQSIQGVILAVIIEFKIFMETVQYLLEKMLVHL